MADAAKEMGEALIINPFHGEDFAKALEQALAMPLEEQVRRNQLMQERARRYARRSLGQRFCAGHALSIQKLRGSSPRTAAQRQGFG